MLKILLFFASKCYIFIPKPPRMAYSPSERASISSIFLKTILGTFLPHLEPDPYLIGIVIQQLKIHADPYRNTIFTP
jgi:hypothetical protein